MAKIEIVACEAWQTESVFILLLIGKYESGVNCVYQGYIDTALDMQREKPVLPVILDFIKFCDPDQPEATLKAMRVKKSEEFMTEKGAYKYARRTLSAHLEATNSSGDWRPSEAWKRLTPNRPTLQGFQDYDPDAKAKAKKREAEKLQRLIENDERKSKNRFSDSDNDYAARRRRKKRLKEQHKKLTHGGESA